ncbi:hypothetical protein DS745_03455 [Anaerobacillus alkaliphilus]|uniref:DUF4181 domain-containing protein n=1 Tax=Anaerobacillus alkaliphilus TaxID=1548597 RepID=A0A4Q0VXH6_9BACI|nr:hypothetical protein [Anaerobacillus alkaliphilus]RXJ04453.1 hypothetical protein DS745_03455 [Anaerobacillus alkaliphilus]
MKEGNNRNLYFNMVLGAIGIILVFIGTFEFLKVVEILKGFFLIMVGMFILIRYIYQLEEKVGISRKTIWIKAVILIGIVFGFFYFY